MHCRIERDLANRVPAWWNAEDLLITRNAWIDAGRLAGFVLLLGLLAGACAAADAPADNAYQPVWESLSDLLQRREYGNAAALLEASREKPELRSHQALLEADRAVVEGLQALERAVGKQARKLQEGATFKLSGVECKLVRIEQKPIGDEMVLKSASTGLEIRKAVNSLPLDIWMQLAGDRPESVPQPSLVLGVLAGFDQTPDVKTARRLLNGAAADGADVTIWLSRLDAWEAARSRGKQKSNTPEEPRVVSTWAHQVSKDGKVIKRQTLTLYSNGRINDPNGNATWQTRGNVLVLLWPAPDAPRGQWQDVCNLSAAGDAYLGKNQQGFVLRGVLMKKGDDSKD